MLSNISETKILFVGDMHLGRAPGGVSMLPDRANLGPTMALDRVVATAIAHGVHAVAFAGDLVESSNALFEAYGPLQNAALTLKQHHIETIAVAGNHDTLVLPRLLKAMAEGIHVLGKGGTWSSHLVRGQAPLPVRLVGWSFPAAHCSFSPLRQDPPARQEGEITLGLLHADLDVAKSDYAPVSAKELLATGYQGWFLGHIHRPDTPPQDLAPFYLGSLTPLDPSEIGTHGPVLVTVHPDASLTAERLPLAPLQWQHLVVTCPPLSDPREDLPPLLLEHMLKVLGNLPPRAEPLLGLGFRVRLTGRIPDPSAVHAAVAAMDLVNLTTISHETTLFVEKLTCEVTAAHDLKRLAVQGDPVGLLARRILELENPDGTVPNPASPLLAAAGDIQKALGHRNYYASLASQNPDIDPQALRKSLTRVAYRLLDVMVEEGGSRGASI